MKALQIYQVLNVLNSILVLYVCVKHFLFLPLIVVSLTFGPSKPASLSPSLLKFASYTSATPM